MRQAYDYWQDQPGNCPKASGRERARPHRKQTATRGRTAQIRPSLDTKIGPSCKASGTVVPTEGLPQAAPGKWQASRVMSTTRVDRPRHIQPLLSSKTVQPTLKLLGNGSADSTDKQPPASAGQNALPCSARRAVPPPDDCTRHPAQKLSRNASPSNLSTPLG